MPNNYVRFTLPRDNSLFVCGDFTQLSGQTRSRIAHFDSESGNLSLWAPVINDIVWRMAVADGTLYATGEFDEVGGEPIWRLAAFEMLGDMNCDGLLNGADIQPYVLALIDPLSYSAAYTCCQSKRADMDQNGAADLGDVSSFVDALIALP
jgi:hypothetical protein